MLHLLAPYATGHAGAPGAVVWAASTVSTASVPHLHALGDPGTAVLGIGGLVTVTALLSPAAAVLLTAITLGQISVISQMPMAASINDGIHHTVHDTVNHAMNITASHPLSHPLSHAAVIWAGAGPNPQMDPNGLPGGGAATKLVGGLMFYGLLACAAAIVLGVMAFTAGKILTNHYAGVTGRIAVLAGIIGAVFIGGCMTLVNWAFHLGTTFTPN